MYMLRPNLFHNVSTICMRGPSSIKMEWRRKLNSRQVLTDKKRMMV
ncbi:hypothetical protein A2U01_0112412, partial [Trifolium medium]|nr:hypothetical protein [Trifolium medium]